MNEKLNVSKRKEHLNSNVEGAGPIIASLGTEQDFGGELNSIRKRFEESANATNVDYYNSSNYESSSFIGKFNVYLISNLDNLNKFSKELYDCTSLIVTGIDKETEKNISFLTHQLAAELSETDEIDFISDLELRLNEVKKKCKPGTIDAVIVGGRFYTNPQTIMTSSIRQNYLDSIDLLGRKVRQTLGFEPVVINGPKNFSGADNIYYDNEKRRLYFVRFEGNPDARINPKARSFMPSDAEKHTDEWDDELS